MITWRRTFLRRAKINAHDDAPAYADAIRKHLTKTGVSAAPMIADGPTTNSLPA